MNLKNEFKIIDIKYVVNEELHRLQDIAPENLLSSIKRILHITYYRHIKIVI